MKDNFLNSKVDSMHQFGAYPIINKLQMQFLPAPNQFLLAFIEKFKTPLCHFTHLLTDVNVEK